MHGPETAACLAARMDIPAQEHASQQERPGTPPASSLVRSGLLSLEL